MASRFVQVAHKGDKSTFKVKSYFTVGTLITQVDCHTTVQVGHLTETLSQDVKVVVTCLHHFQVGQEGGDGACIVLFNEIQFEQRCDGYTSFVTLPVENAFAFDIDLAPFR